MNNHKKYITLTCRKAVPPKMNYTNWVKVAFLSIYTGKWVQVKTSIYILKSNKFILLKLNQSGSR